VTPGHEPPAEGLLTSSRYLNSLSHIFATMDELLLSVLPEEAGYISLFIVIRYPNLDSFPHAQNTQN
jgi:hypothetical protein